MRLAQSLSLRDADTFGRKTKCFSEDEWSPLKEVIVGRAEHSQFPSERMSVMASMMTKCYLDEFRPNNPFPADIVEKAQIELDNFAAVLESFGVVVHRPELVDWGKVGGYTGSMPRDGLLVVGDTIIESSFSWKCRRHEVELAYGPILKMLAEKGYRIVRAPKPPEVDRIFEVGPASKFCINNSRVAFDAAEFTRLGKTVVGRLSHMTNEKGLDYVRAHLPAGYNLVVIDSHDERAMHIDTTLVPMMDGTAIYNPGKVDFEELRRHKPLNTWRLLPEPYKPKDSEYPPPYMSGPDLIINVLSLDEKRVICEKDDLKMQEFYRELGMEPIALPFRHVWSLGGSFHCATVDLRRERRTSDCKC